MASDDTMTIHSMHEEEEDDDDEEEEEEEEEDGDDHHHHASYTTSRLSLCISNSKEYSMFEEEDGGGDDDDMIMDMSRLYVGSEEEADGEFSEGKGGKEGFDDSDKEMGWSSLPGSPFLGVVGGELRKYGSESEGRRGGTRRIGKRRLMRERWLERAWEKRKSKAADEETDTYASGESERVVIARQKGGGRRLCMDMEEVKACRDLGFDLQHEWTLEIPTSISASASLDTDSGGNSPVANWKISTAGDDPNDIKARLKVWAQAVAIASTYQLMTS